MTCFCEKEMDTFSTGSVGKATVLLNGSDSFVKCCGWGGLVGMGMGLLVCVIVMIVMRGVGGVHGRMAFVGVCTLELGLFRKLRATALAWDGRRARGRDDERSD